MKVRTLNIYWFLSLLQAPLLQMEHCVSATGAGSSLKGNGEEASNEVGRKERAIQPQKLKLKNALYLGRKINLANISAHPSHYQGASSVSMRSAYTLYNVKCKNDQ